MSAIVDQLLLNKRVAVVDHKDQPQGTGKVIDVRFGGYTFHLHIAMDDGSFMDEPLRHVRLLSFTNYEVALQRHSSCRNMNTFMSKKEDGTISWGAFSPAYPTGAHLIDNHSTSIIVEGIWSGVDAIRQAWLNQTGTSCPI